MANIHDDPHSDEQRDRIPARVAVQKRELELAILTAEGELYASADTATVMQTAEGEIDAMSDETDDYCDLPKLHERTSAIRNLADSLRDKAQTLARAGRRHLGVPG